MPDPVDSSTAKRQSWRFERGDGEWQINGQSFDRFATPYQILEGTAEQWTVINGGGSCSHPVHIHYEEHRYLSYNRLPPTPTEVGRKDVIRLDPNATVEIAMRFRHYKGIYPMHCHPDRGQETIVMRAQVAQGHEYRG
jgi:FtsP/CotA-like multicopper oxidase with cupredoxin domain